MARIDGYAPIGDYAVIGDTRTAALVAGDGSIDWLCLPDVDAPSVLGALLDPAEGGRFSFQPTIPFRSERRYVEQTNVLETTFSTDRGQVRVTDAFAMPVGEAATWRELARRVEGLSGQVPMQWRVDPRFGYGERDGQIALRDGTAIVSGDGGLNLAVRTWDAGGPGVAHGAVHGEAEIAGGDRALVALLAADGAPLPLPDRDAVERRLDATVEAWRRWLRDRPYGQRWGGAVERSLLAIRLLTDARTGAIAAAATTSLPERIGGERNYDYRFAWIRDLSFTLDALIRCGFDELAHLSFGWMLRATGRTHPRLNPVYRLDGEVVLEQVELGFPGYRRSRPTYVGNQAGSQLQLGAFGDFLETTWLYADRGGLALDAESARRIADIADLLTRLWRNDDAGLWELSDYAAYTTSKLGCWVAFDRSIRLAEGGHIPSRDVSRWRRAREDVKGYVETELWSEERRSYVQKPGSTALDAGCLLAARRGFADPEGERMAGTIDAIRGELSAGGPLLFRYSGMQDEENAFVACSFWLVEALSLAGRFDEAASLMDELVELGTDVGLYAEEIDPDSHEMRGNIPQALSHLSLITAASIFDESLRSRG